MEQKREQWIDGVMQSLTQMQPAESNPFLHTRVLQKIAGSRGSTTIPSGWVYAMAGLFVLLFLVNIWALERSGTPGRDTAGIEAVAREYGLTDSGNYTLNF